MAGSSSMKNGVLTMKVVCDSCGARAPSGKAILAGRGLNNMGWHCRGGSHICPACPQPEKQ